VEDHEAAQARAQDHLPPEKEVEGDGITLRQRAAPFIDLLRCSAEAGKDVVWGV
jgi:hypothetical protein